ncbi:hypothetical protein Hanom_Chr11g01024571 [Helianthus anomalus]
MIILYKQTEEWAATAGLKKVRTLAKLLSDECKSWKETLSNERKTWKESWAKQNETLFHVRQELTNVKATNAALVKGKVAAEAVVREAKEAKARAAKALEEANADRTHLNKTIEGLQRSLPVRPKLKRRQRMLAEARYSLVSSFDQLQTDRDWMRDHDIGHIIRAILDAPENAAGVEEIRLRTREVGFKAGYNRCISHMNVLSQGKYTDERFGFHGVDTEARLAAALAAYNDMSISALEELDKFLDAEDYVDRSRLLYANDEEEEEEEETAGDGKGGAGTSGTK